MGIFPWYLTSLRKQLIEEINKTPDAKKGLSHVMEEALLEWVKNHGSGNPLYKLDNWTKNPEFQAFPAFMSSYEDLQKWFTTQAQRKDWNTMKDVKFKLQEWQGLLKTWYGL